MPGIFDAGRELSAKAYGWCGESITYTSGTTSAAGIPAKPGRTVFRFVGENGLTVRTERRDFIVRLADLAIEPQVGDIITRGTERFLVTAPNNEPCWKWHSDTERRIHTEVIA